MIVSGVPSSIVSGFGRSGVISWPGLGLSGRPGVGSLASFQFVTLIIYYSLLLAWPGISPRKRIVSSILFFPALLLFILVDIPVTIISSIDLACIQKLRGITLDETIRQKIVLFLSHFINNGGRQFFAVTLFALTVLPFRMRNHPKKSAGAGRKNA